ncbi:hypothetical protein [Streptomyces griseoaurantiacus]|uniref:hypothetical protein n=1 Tax=Streptomyces griseoaurantiacus TaxID=68213 RepID=UPI0036B5A9B3
MSNNPPRPASEYAPKGAVSVDECSMPFAEAAAWLGCSQEEMAVLVERSRVNVKRGLVGPLEITNKGVAVTLRSLFAHHRRRVAASAR